MITPAQSRAARGWLDWSQEELAKRATVSLSTVKDFERGRRTPIGNNLSAMAHAFEAAGMQLLNDENGIPTGVAERRTSGAPFDQSS